MEEFENELAEIGTILAGLRPPELPPTRAKGIQAAAANAFAKRTKHEFSGRFGPLLADLAETTVISGLGGIYMVWAIVRTVTLLGIE